MYPGERLRLVLVLALMFAFLIMRSKLAEYRTDDISVDGAWVGVGRLCDAACARSTTRQQGAGYYRGFASAGPP